LKNNILNKICAILLLSVFLNLTGISIYASDSLKLAIHLNKKDFRVNDSIIITYSLSTTSNQQIRIAKSISGNEGIWFRLKIEDEKGNLLLTGMEEQFINRTALPFLKVDTISQNHQLYVQNFFVPGNILSNTFTYIGLTPGKYKIFGVYRFEPDKEPEVAGLYKRFIKEYHLWTGICFSGPVEIMITDE
jgi:hypothetical protein